MHSSFTWLSQSRLSHTSWKRQVCTSESYTTPSLHSRLAVVKRPQTGKAGEKARLAHASNTALHQSSPTLLYSAADAVGWSRRTSATHCAQRLRSQQAG